MTGRRSALIRCLRIAALLTTVFAATISTASAQTWHLEMQAGEIRSALDPSAGQTAGVKSSLIGGVRYDHPTAGFRLSAGIPTRKDEAIWGAAGGWKRVTLHREGVFLGLDLAGNGFLLRERTEPAAQSPGFPFPGPASGTPDRYGHALAGQLLPVIGFDTGILEVRGRAGISHFGSWFGSTQRQRTVQLADAQLTFTPESPFIITPIVRGYRAEEGNYAYAGVSGVAGYGRVTAWGSAGQWVAGRGAQGGVPWGVGATVRVLPRVSLNASRRQDTIDPLYSSPPQTSWSVGFSIQVAGPDSPPPPPLPSTYIAGRATIRLPLAESPTPPRIAGDFNNWKPQTMDRTGNSWTYTTAMPPGVYSYAFVNTQDEWFVPQSVPGRRPDGMGGHVAILVVR